MPMFRFEIQNCIDVDVEADNVEEARMFIIENIKEYADDLIGDACVSNGMEKKQRSDKNETF